MTRFAQLTLLGLLVGSAAACATYRARPLSTESTLRNGVPRMTIDARDMPLPELAAHVFDPSDGLDIAEAAMLAVVNNPDLRTARANAAIAHAQAFAAGLLPDPQMSIGVDVPAGGAAAPVAAYGLGISEDIIALLTHGPLRDAARRSAEATDLSVLWQEWQIVARVRQLFVQLQLQGEARAVLDDYRAAFADRYRRTQTALDRGLLTLDTVTPHLTGLQDVERQIHDMERLTTQNRHDLMALLGLAPDVAVSLVGSAAPPVLDDATLVTIVADLPRRRPDLIALQRAYDSQELRYRAAVLAQFPAVNVGFTRASDTSNVHTAGFGVTLNVPIFSRNRGPIAVEQATRDALHVEYQQRLNTADGNIRRLITEQRLNDRQLADVDRGLTDLSRAARNAEAALQARNVDVLAFSNLQTAVLAKKIERIALHQAVLEQGIAVQTLTGGDVPVGRLP
jgi:outer membrane protein TolC